MKMAQRGILCYRLLGRLVSQQLWKQNSSLSFQPCKPFTSDGNGEVKKAKLAMHADGQQTLFSKIIDRSLPATIVYEDEKCLAFHDVNPQAPVHFLVIPKQAIPQLSKASDEDAPLLGHLLNTARKVANDMKLSKGYRVVINDGVEGSQSIYHLHVHVLGGRQMNWPPG